MLIIRTVQPRIAVRAVKDRVGEADVQVGSGRGALRAEGEGGHQDRDDSRCPAAAALSLGAMGRMVHRVAQSPAVLRRTP